MGVESVVRMTSKKAIIEEKAIHFGIPRSRGLFETIERLPKVTNKVGVILDKAKGVVPCIFLHANLHVRRQI